MDTTTHPPRPFALDPPAGAAARLRSLVRGRTGDPAWARPALLGVLALTALLYLWGLDRNGDANSYCAAAVLSGTRSTALQRSWVMARGASAAARTRRTGQGRTS